MRWKRQYRMKRKEEEIRSSEFSTLWHSGGPIDRSDKKGILNSSRTKLDGKKTADDGADNTTQPNRHIQGHHLLHRPFLTHYPGITSTPSRLLQIVNSLLTFSLSRLIQLKALLTHNHAKSAPESTDDFNHENFQPEGTSHQASSSPQPNPNFKPRFDLTQTTHIITNSLHLPEYIVLGKWDDQAGNILTFSYQPQPNQSNHHNRASPSNDQNKSRLHRSIHLITPIWVTQSYDLNKLLPTVSYSPDPYMFFSGIVIALDSAAKLPLADVELIQACTQAWGGQFRRGLTKEVTHLICCDEETRDYQIASKLKRELGIKIVLPHWLVDLPFEKKKKAELLPLSFNHQSDLLADR